MTAQPEDNRGELDDLKAQVDLVELVRQSGLELKKTGRNWLCRCPFHEDETASLSVNPAQQLWNCFGCEAGGDALEWLKRRGNLSFPEAVKRLRSLAGRLPAPESKGKPKKDEPLPAGLSRSHVFSQVLEHYRKGLRESPEAQAYLASRGLASRELMEAFRIGYADGTLLSILPQNGPVREALMQMGLLNAKGREHFRGCLVFPLDHPELETVGFYGRRITDGGEIKHLYLPGPKRGVLNWQAVKLSPKIWVAESVLDALSLWTAGVKDVTCLFGAGGLHADLEALLERFGTREIVFCLDADRAGREAVTRLGTALTARKIACHQSQLPDGQDPNQLLVQDGAQALKAKASRTTPLELSAPAPTKESYRRTQDGFSLELGDVSYKLTPQPPFGSRLRVTLRALRGSQVYLDTVDFYSNRYRSAAAVQLVRRLDLPRADAERHLMLILERSEEWAAEALADSKKAEHADEETTVEMTAAEREEALEFLESPDLIQNLLRDTETMGYVGEENGKLLTYLIGVSRKLHKPLSGIVRSQSGAGKSTLTEMVEQLTPPEDVREFSRLSAQALSFMPKDYLRRKLLIIEERAGSEAADYQIRTLQTRHRLSQAVVLKDPVTGKLSTRFFEVLGPIAYLETTTNHQLNPENASRCFEIHLDESEEQTVRIQHCQRQLRESRPFDRQLAVEAIKRRHHNAQRLLEQVLVYIPYAKHLKFPSRWLRTRRDNERFLCLIEAVAFLHQFQRERGKTCEGTPYILATAEDYRLAFTLAHSVLLNSLHELSREGQELLESIRCWAEDKGEDPYKVLFTRKELRQYTSHPDYRLRTSLNELADMEYIQVVSGSNGKAFHYKLLDVALGGYNPLGCLTTPHELEAILEKEQGADGQADRPCE